MLLRTTLTSPFGRKARMAAVHLGLMEKVSIAAADAIDPRDPLRRDNPLGKMPTLVLDDGRVLYDSRVILEYFDHIAGGGRILPVDFDARIEALRRQALADGIMDAGILIVYEGRHRPLALHHEPWLDYQRGKIMRGLAALAADPPPADATVGGIATACALGYLDWRKQVDWRASSPALVEWLDAFKAAVPAFEATAAME